LVAGVGGVGVVSGLKYLFHRPRPDAVFDVLGYSFPSGHSFFALVVYGFLAYVLTRDMVGRRKEWIWLACVLAILLVGFSRVFLGEHYPSDVVAGFAVGLPWLWGCLALPTAFRRNGHKLSLDEIQAQFNTGKAELKEAALFLPNLLKLCVRLARDTRVPISRKIGLALLTGYLAMPFDLIPDFIPVIGVADDIILVTVTIHWVISAVPREVVTEHWDGTTDLFALLDGARDGIRKLMNRS
jgi:uncharacterized membrane protein YkvA (DUF1232 family)